MTSPSPYDFKTMSKDEVVEALMNELWEFQKGVCPNDEGPRLSHAYEVYLAAKEYLGPFEEPRLPIRLDTDKDNRRKRDPFWNMGVEGRNEQDV